MKSLVKILSIAAAITSLMGSGDCATSEAMKTWEIAPLHDDDCSKLDPAVLETKADIETIANLMKMFEVKKGKEPFNFEPNHAEIVGKLREEFPGVVFEIEEFTVSTLPGMKGHSLSAFCSKNCTCSSGNTSIDICAYYPDMGERLKAEIQAIHPNAQETFSRMISGMVTAINIEKNFISPEEVVGVFPYAFSFAYSDIPPSLRFIGEAMYYRVADVYMKHQAEGLERFVHEVIDQLPKELISFIEKGEISAQPKDFYEKLPARIKKCIELHRKIEEFFDMVIEPFVNGWMSPNMKEVMEKITEKVPEVLKTISKGKIPVVNRTITKNISMEEAVEKFGEASIREILQFSHFQAMPSPESEEKSEACGDKKD